MEISFSTSIRVPGIGKGCEYTEDVWWSSQEQGYNWTVSKSFNDRWEEACDASGETYTVNHDHLISTCQYSHLAHRVSGRRRTRTNQNPHLNIFARQNKAVTKALLLV